MGKLASLVVTAVISVACGLLGAFAAVHLSADQLRGPQGATGLAGAPGVPGPPGQDGADGQRGPRGAAGKAASPAKLRPTALGTSNCAGPSVTVVTEVTVVAQKVRLTKKSVCVVR